MGGNKKEKGSAAVEAAAPSPPAPPAPPAPEMPKIGISQLLPMVLLLGMNKFDPEKMGYQRHIEIGYVVVQIVCLAVLGLLYTKITAMPEDNSESLVVSMCARKHTSHTSFRSTVALYGFS